MRHSAQISADSPVKSGVASHKVSANHNRCHYWCVSKHQMPPRWIYITERRHRVAGLRESLGLDRVMTVYVVQSAQWTLNCHDPICSRQFTRVVNKRSREYVRQALKHAYSTSKDRHHTLTVPEYAWQQTRGTSFQVYRSILIGGIRCPTAHEIQWNLTLRSPH